MLSGPVSSGSRRGFSEGPRLFLLSFSSPLGLILVFFLQLRMFPRSTARKRQFQTVYPLVPYLYLLKKIFRPILNVF